MLSTLVFFKNEEQKGAYSKYIFIFTSLHKLFGREAVE